MEMPILCFLQARMATWHFGAYVEFELLYRLIFENSFMKNYARVYAYIHRTSTITNRVGM